MYNPSINIDLFSGRLNRRGFLIRFLFAAILFAVSDIMIKNTEYLDSYLYSGVQLAVILITGFGSIFYLSSITVRRFHDIGRSGFFILPYLGLPVFAVIVGIFDLEIGVQLQRFLQYAVGILWVIVWLTFPVLFFIKGNSGNNEFSKTSG